jgi:hypothetical protein
MFVFFSISVGKRAVYLLPLYPALSLLLAQWFYASQNLSRGRVVAYRIIAAFTAITGFLLLIITFGALWSHDAGWFFAPFEGLLKPKDRANVKAVIDQMDNFGWSFTFLSLAAGTAWLTLSRSLWRGQMRSVAHLMIVISVVYGTIGSLIIMPMIARERSYREFMIEVNQRVKPDDKLYIYGRFNSDPVVFYRGGPIERLKEPFEAVAPKIGGGDAYIIMPAPRPGATNNLPPPLIKSAGSGPEGDAPLVLVRADLP